jgi:hypothetical protein
VKETTIMAEEDLKIREALRVALLFLDDGFPERARRVILYGLDTTKTINDISVLEQIHVSNINRVKTESRR